MSTSNTGNKIHDDTVRVAEGIRQAAVAGAGSQVATRTAEVTFYRTVLASALANSVGPGTAIQALRDLGTGGS